MDEKNKKLIGELNQWIREKQDKNEEKKGGYIFYLGLGAILLLTYGGAVASYYFSEPKPINRVPASLNPQHNPLPLTVPIPSDSAPHNKRVHQRAPPAEVSPRGLPPRDPKGKSKKKAPRTFEYKQDEYGFYKYEDSDY